MSRQRSRLFTIPLLAITTAVGLAAPASAGGRGVPLDQLRVTTTEVAADLEKPTSIAGLPDGRLLITEKPGRIRVYDPRTGLSPTPVLDISDRINDSEAERGLLALAPDYGRTKNVYVAYTGLPDGAVTLSRVRLTTGTEQVLLTQEHAEFGNHNGGHVTFGPDGYLYLGIGDGGSGGDPFGSGQHLGTLLGKILRIDVGRTCGALPYCVPRSNPFVGVSGARPEIWAWGLRNPWKFSFDKADGSLWIADVGQGRYEEIDHIGGRDGGVNFGWSCMEGPVVFDETRCDPAAELTAPVFHYRSGIEGCAVIGGAVYRGQRYADLAGGTYVAADFCAMTAYGLRAGRDGTHTGAAIGTFPEYVTAFGTDHRGEFYVVTETPGKLYRVGFTRVS
ncbi:PQQ-dependent sugar dehydrogenase [Actinophytocola algeriensis]|uniref:Glucose/arabinose dehydrogenase n=1 Tax=Actinophytocola algeriensis TaxID=1768010 RepID=A0A7W7VIP1_9PSEU|nr:PQQ-dependent sugar dehydrogenase [Actinophytocola algeriensis]MBB4911731.1 glucose/arabinose dehydrogenase [Actinophytocola algeriensis]MBE1473281.1 glucose/arabinose dehydrogenase [Actinophytocola algeriensis]